MKFCSSQGCESSDFNLISDFFCSSQNPHFQTFNAVWNALKITFFQEFQIISEFFSQILSHPWVVLQHILSWPCLSSFPRVETRFNTHYQNAYANTFRNAFLELLRLSLNYIASTSREEGLVTAQLHCAVWPIEHTPSRSVGDIKAFQNNFAFIISTEMCFWLKCV